MKTFETEKHNIPEGATGYREQGQYIEWFSGGNGSWRLIGSNVPSLEMCDSLLPVIQIHQQEVEWKNGDECLYLNERECIFIGMRMNSKTHCIIETKNNSTYMPVNIKELSKPESPEEREKRERLEAAWDLYLFSNSKVSELDRPLPAHGWENLISEQKSYWLAIVDKTNYRKESN